MSRATETVAALLFACVGLIGCGSAQSPAPSSSDEEGARGELTAEACEASGGKVVGDIGDGAIHRADYRCPSGAEPSGNIRAPEGGPMGVEGSVCCPE